jgi:Stress-induced bacterial acidophilic repeat motif.
MTTNIKPLTFDLVPRKRGFAAMDPKRVKEIASMGGAAAHAKGTAHVFNSEEAMYAGRKGAAARIAKRGK